MSSPSISIITVCRNAEATIARTIQSVAEQRGVNDGQLEHWVIDGASTDGTLDIVRSFSHVKWISEADRGIADAFNKGVLRSTGDWILILNSGDALASPDVLSRILPYLKPPLDFVYGRTEIRDDQLKSPLFLMGASESWHYLRRRMAVPHPALFSKRDLFSRYGFFSEKYKVAMDYEWLLRSYFHAKHSHAPITVSLFRSGGASSSRYAWRQAIECWRAKATHRIGNSAGRFSWFLYQYLRTSLDYHFANKSVHGNIYRALINKFKKPF